MEEEEEEEGGSGRGENQPPPSSLPPPLSKPAAFFDISRAKFVEYALLPSFLLPSFPVDGGDFFWPPSFSLSPESQWEW